MQGDDVLFTTTSVGAVETLVAMYGTLGYKVHPQKHTYREIEENFYDAVTRGGGGCDGIYT